MAAVAVDDPLADVRIDSIAVFPAPVSGSVVDAPDEPIWLSHEARSTDNVKNAIADSLPVAKRYELFIQPPR